MPIGTPTSPKTVVSTGADHKVAKRPFMRPAMHKANKENKKIFKNSWWRITGVGQRI
jgi:hypothetical protein